MKLSVIIPVYNEERRIGASLEKIFLFLKSMESDFEVIIVDDGSVDDTGNILREYSKKTGFISVLRNDKNRGKGYSVKRGVLSSKGDIVLYTDADLSTPIEELNNLAPWLGNGFHIAIGSRDLPESVITTHQPWYREFMGKAFNRILRLILGLDFHDTQCGFKCFQRGAALELFNSIKSCHFAFDAEVLLLAKMRGFQVKEVPVHWVHYPDSKVRLVKDSSKMLWDVLKMKLAYAFKK